MFHNQQTQIFSYLWSEGQNNSAKNRSKNICPSVVKDEGSQQTVGTQPTKEVLIRLVLIYSD